MSTAVRNVRLLLLGAGVALAFADSSIVVLALPELLQRFQASIAGVAWVITSYNVAVAVAALPLVRLARRANPARLARRGLVVFGLASLACALAPSLWTLVGFRSVQGLGGAMLLAASLPVARALAEDAARGTRGWAAAGTFGVAVGPAAGGALTQAFDWRAIFLAQAPVAAGALLATVGRTARVDGPPPEASRRRALGAGVGLVFLSGALVGALFLVVVLLVDVWGYGPLAAAALVSALPAGTLVTRRLGSSTAGGALLLGSGLAAIALAPGSAPVWTAGGLFLCGAGFGLAAPRLTATAGPWSVAARHAGLVAGLVLLTPVLAADLTNASAAAERAGTALVLDAPVPTATKVPLAADLLTAIRHTPHGALPEFSEVFAQHERTPALARLHRSLDDTIRAVVTRGFRRAFLLAALLALPLLSAARPRASNTVLLGRGTAAAGAVAALLVAELAAGGLSYGRVAVRNPCRPPPTVPGGGLDPAAQRIVLRGVDELACRLGRSREQLVLDAAARARAAQRWVERTFG